VIKVGLCGFTIGFDEYVERQVITCVDEPQVGGFRADENVANMRAFFATIERPNNMRFFGSRGCAAG
jgi:hypothetical protein